MGFRSSFRGVGAIAPALLVSGHAAAAEIVPEASRGDTAWLLIASALVLLMTLPGLALFYAGLVRARNALSILMNCFAICCVVSLIWIVFGYSLAFDPGTPWLGGLSHLFLNGAQPVMSNGLPEPVFALFQMTFAIITPALIIGAFPERTPFTFVAVFSAVWTIVVYLPVAHWVWGGGWLSQLGALDFAGGVTVHTTAGVSALVAAMMIGRRRGFPTELIPPHSPAMVMVGGGLLWVGWFGFNGGSALGANAGAASAILSTHVAACAGALTWTVIEWTRMGKPTSVGLVTGCVAGLATITPGAGYIGPAGAMIVGVAAGVVCFHAVNFVKGRLRVDDSLDVFAVHGVGGMLGSLLTAVLAAPALGGATLSLSWSAQLGVQAAAVGVTAVYSGVVTFVLIKLLGLFVDIRVGAEEEREGIDLTTHGERAYDVA